MKPEIPNLRVGDRARVLLDSGYWRSQGWFEGTIVRIDLYSAHRNFYWVELDIDVETTRGGTTRLVSVLNPEHIVGT